MADPRPTIEVLTNLDTAKPPSRKFREWSRAFGQHRMDAYRELRDQAVERPGWISQRTLLQLLHCHRYLSLALLNELKSLGLIDVRNQDGSFSIRVRAMPKKMPKDALIRDRAGETAGDVIAAYRKRGFQVLGELPTVNRGKDYRIAGRLLDDHGVKMLDLLAWNYFDDVQRGAEGYRFASFGHFATQIPLLISKRGPIEQGARLVKSAEWYQGSRDDILNNQFMDKRTKKRELAALDQEYQQHLTKKAQRR